MSGGAFLKMEPFYRLEGGGIKRMPKSNRIIRSYYMTVFLTKMPVFGDKDTPQEEKDKFQHEISNGCWEWFPIENGNGSFTVEKIWQPGTNQTIRV
jgi:hypothetical protein